MKPNLLIVASIRSWHAEDLAKNTIIPLVHEIGLDAPIIPDFVIPAWWSPQEYITRLILNDHKFTLQSVGPTWISTLPLQYTGRKIWSGQVKDYKLGKGFDSGFLKLAEAKSDKFIASWISHRYLVYDAIASGSLSDDSWIQISDRFLDIDSEYRFWILNKEVVTGSMYLASNGDTWDPSWSQENQNYYEEAYHFTKETVAKLDSPTAYVLDVARLKTGEWVILEANAAWSSAWYGGEIDAVVATILASNDTSGIDKKYVWSPDSSLIEKFRFRQPLKESEPIWAERLKLKKLKK
jgi:hypothetical protein